MLPTPAIRTLTVGGLDISDLVEWDSLDRLETEHGDASLTVELPLEDQWQALPAEIAKDAAVTYCRDGTTLFAGTVARPVRQGLDEEAVLRLECRGPWAELSDRDDYVKGFVDRRTSEWQQVPCEVFGRAQKLELVILRFDNDGQLHFVLEPNSATGDTMNTYRSYFAYYALSGLDRSCAISRLRWNLHRAGTYTPDLRIFGMRDLFDNDMRETGDWWTNYPSYNTYERFDSSSPPGSVNQRAVVVEVGFTGSTLGGSEYSNQLLDVVVYIDRTSEPTIPSALYEAASGLGIATSLKQSGSWPLLTQLMWDAPATPADHFAATIARHSSPVLCRIDRSRALEIKPRPAAPDGSSRHFVVSRALQPGMSWGVVRDDEAAKDYVACDYRCDVVDPWTPYPNGSTWADDWTRSSTTNVFANASDFYARCNSTVNNPNAYTTVLKRCNQYQRYRFRTLRIVGSHPGSGQAFMEVQWFNSSAAWLATTTIYTATGSTSWGWVTSLLDAPAGAAYYRINWGWRGVSYSGGSYFDHRLKRVECRPVMPTETQQRVYYPGTPSGNKRVGLIQIDTASADTASAAAVYAHSLWSDPYEGPVSGLVGTIRDVNGAVYPVEEIRAWDWIEDLDAPEGERGPHLITQVYEAGEEIDLYCGGDVAFHYERELVAKRGPYIAGRRWRVKVAPAKFKWVRNEKGKKVRKLVRKAKYAWRETQGYYL